MKHPDYCKTFITLLAFWMSLTLSYGQSGFSQKFGTETDYKRLYFLNLQYTQSWVRSDTATYNKLLWAEDFVHQNSSDGLLYPKKKISALFGRPRFDKLEYFYPENVIIQFITNDAAMVFARPPFCLAGESTESFSQYNDIYVRREGKWICVSANVVSVAKPGDARPAFSKLPEPTPFISWHQGSKNDRSELERLNTAYTEAIARSKSESLSGILADDFVLLAANGQLYKKHEALEQLQKNPAKPEACNLENLNIRFVAADVAMIHAITISTWKDGSKSAIQFNNIYVKRDSRWICVSGNDTSIRN